MTLFLVILFFISPAHAHKIADTYLRIQVKGSTIRGEWNISLDDLAKTAGLSDKRFMKNFALDHLHISTGDNRCTLHSIAPKPKDTLNGTAPDIVFEGECATTISKLTVDYSPFLTIDPLYATLAAITSGTSTWSGQLSMQKPIVVFQAGKVDPWQEFKDYLHEGIWHIWLGYDHILFLISLLLSAAFVLGKNHTWEPRDGFTGTFVQVLKIVTAFTLAHSITLSLVIFDIISLPSRFVESTIALSIAIAAANNLRPVLHKKLWQLAFCFGLIHGMGFASALKELGLPDNARWTALVAFNLGVEIGQVSIVAVTLPFIYRMRRSAFYRHYIFKIMSTLIIAIALIWFTQRAFGLTLLKGVFGE
jgi:hypothetical protein